MSKKAKTLLITVVALLLPITGILAATYYGVIDPSKYLSGSIGQKLGFLSQYKSAIEENRSSSNIDPELLKKIEEGLNEEEIRTCFNAKIKNQMEELGREIVAYCDQRRDEIEHLIHLFNTLPASEIPCEITAPYLLDGCQGELCSARVDPIVAKATTLMSAVIDGKEIKPLQANEKLKEIIEFKIFVKKIGKAKALDEITADMLKQGINRGSTFSVISYAGEGWEVGCSGKETFGFEANYQTLSPYEAENWVYVETEDGTKGYIQYSALRTNESG